MDTSFDGFLGGAINVRQPLHGYRAATDPVFLAASIPARSGDSVLELGCGVGVASLCLAHRVPGLTCHGVELQPEYARLARENARLNGLAVQITTGDLTRLPNDIKAQQFDHVMFNPPFYDAAAHSAPQDAGRRQAHVEETPLALWLDVAIRRCRPRGWVSVIHRAERLGELLSGVQDRCGAIRILPLQAHAGAPAKRVLVQARPGAGTPLTLLAGLSVHDRAGADSAFTPDAEKILRSGAALNPLAQR